MRIINKNDLIAVYQDLVEFLQLEDCYEPNCKCMNDPDLLFEETVLSKKMDPYEISIKAMNYSADELGKNCLIKKNKQVFKHKKN